MLADIAKNDEVSTVRFVAVERLTDQIVLADIAGTDKSEEICMKALDGVADQSLLAEIAKTGKDARVRQAAEKRIAEQSALSAVAWIIFRPAAAAGIVSPRDYVSEAGCQSVQFITRYDRSVARRRNKKSAYGR